MCAAAGELDFEAGAFAAVAVSPCMACAKPTSRFRRAGGGDRAGADRPAHGSDPEGGRLSRGRDRPGQGAGGESAKLRSVDAGYRRDAFDGADVPSQAANCDAVIITAATQSADPIDLAASLFATEVVSSSSETSTSMCRGPLTTSARSSFVSPALTAQADMTASTRSEDSTIQSAMSAGPSTGTWGVHRPRGEGRIDVDGLISRACSLSSARPTHTSDLFSGRDRRWVSYWSTATPAPETPGASISPSEATLNLGERRWCRQLRTASSGSSLKKAGLSLGI